ncbi:MAG: hypothetical protein ABIR84_04775 [Candidatus Nitrotoga sp.]
MWFNPAELTETQPARPATSATLATFPQKEVSNPPKVAEVSRVATPHEATSGPAKIATGSSGTSSDARTSKMVANLKADPGLIYAIQSHDQVEPDAEILTLAIRGKGVCELRVPKSRYDGFAVLELIEKHTTQETLQ